MARNFTGKISTVRYNSKQKNGDTYIYEVSYQYSQEKKRTVRVSNKLIAKIKKGTTEEVPTRPKRKKISCSNDSNISSITASRKHIDLDNILNFVGENSGIDQSMLNSTDEITAKKILSLARFIVATRGKTLPSMPNWQLNHNVPYPYPITENVYYPLLKQIGQDETLRQNYFAERSTNEKKSPIIAFDSTTISTYSENQLEARYGYNKEQDGLKTIKYLTLFSLDSLQPLAFSKQPGNLSDIASLSNTLKQLSVLGLKQPEMVTDNGFHSESNIAEMLLHNFKFITLVKTSLKYVDAEIQKIKNTIYNTRYAILNHDNYDLFSYSSKINYEFEVPNGFENVKIKRMQKNGKFYFEKTLNLHIYFNPDKKNIQVKEFNSEIYYLKNYLENNEDLTQLSSSSLKKIERFLIVKKTKNGLILNVDINYDACEEYCSKMGFFALLTSHDENNSSALSKYRNREKIEEFFKNAKQDADSNRTRSWHSDSLMGRMIVQFVALGYEYFLRSRIKNVRLLLKEELDRNNSSKIENKELKKQLFSWLEKQSFTNILEWFDAYESIIYSNEHQTIRWSSEITKRDKLFLNLIGMDI